MRQPMGGERARSRVADRVPDRPAGRRRAQRSRWSSCAIPDCWFLRLPFYDNRVRISCIDMVKIS